jgi:hypothetical protein
MVRPTWLRAHIVLQIHPRVKRRGRVALYPKLPATVPVASLARPGSTHDVLETRAASSIAGQVSIHAAIWPVRNCSRRVRDSPPEQAGRGPAGSGLFIPG